MTDLDPEAKVFTLEKENAKLKERLAKAEERIQMLEAQLAERQVNRLHDIKEKILVLLSKQNELTTEQISGSLSVGAQLTAFHLKELKQFGKVGDLLATGSPVLWYIKPKGREYLVSHKLRT